MNFALRRGMPAVELHVAAPPASVWNVLVDLDAWPQWGPSVQRAEVDQPGPLRLGSHGRVWTPIGVPLPFTITQFDAGRSWAWEVAGDDFVVPLPLPLPLRHAFLVAAVADVGVIRAPPAGTAHAITPVTPHSRPHRGRGRHRRRRRRSRTHCPRRHQHRHLINR